MRAALLIVALLLAGCASAPPAAQTDAAAAPASVARAVILSPCVEHAADFPISTAEAQRYLPDGMRARALGPDGLAVVEFIAVTCSSELADDGEANAFIAWMLVEPPTDLRAEGEVAGYLYLFSMTTDDIGIAEALAGLGIPVELAPTTFSTAETPAGLLGRGASTAATWSATLETTIAQREVTRSHPLFRVFVSTADGIAAVDVDGGSHPHHDSGAARFTATGDTPFPVPVAPGIGVYGWEGHLGFLPTGTRDAQGS